MPRPLLPPPAAAGLVLALLAAGCQRGGAPAAPPFTGTVTLDGKPLAGATVHLIPTDGGPPATGVGMSNAEGGFELRPLPGQTLRPGKFVCLVMKFTRKPGAPGGTANPDAVAAPPGTVNLLPDAYADRTRSPLKVDVKDKEMTVPPLALKSNP
jgi:hypothetical protein